MDGCWLIWFFLSCLALKFNAFDEHGVLLPAVVLMGASFRANPMTMARVNAVIIFLYAALMGLPASTVSGSSAWMSHLLVLLMIAIGAMLLSVHQTRSRSTLKGVRDVVADVFERLHLNLAVLDEDNRFIHANSRAVETLGKPESDVLRVDFHELMPHLPGGSDPQLENSAHSGMLTRQDGSLCPMAYEKFPLSLPGGVFDSSASDEVLEYQLVIFTDMSGIVQGQEESNLQKRNRTVNTMLEVFADGVRNPLAGISAYVQILERMERKHGEPTGSPSK